METTDELAGSERGGNDKKFKCLLGSVHLRPCARETWSKAA